VWTVNPWLFIFVMAIGLVVGFLPRMLASQPLKEFSVVEELEVELENECQQNEGSLAFFQIVMKFLSESTQFYFGSLNDTARRSQLEDDLEANAKQLLVFSSKIVQNLQRLSTHSERDIRNISEQTKALLEMMKAFHLQTNSGLLKPERACSYLAISQRNTDIPPSFERFLAEVRETLAGMGKKEKSEFAKEVYMQCSILYLYALIIVTFSPAAWMRNHHKILNLFDEMIVRLDSLGENSSHAQKLRKNLDLATKKTTKILGLLTLQPV